MSLGHSKDAAVEFQRVLQRNPRSAAAHYYLAEVHRAKGEIPLALHELQQAVNCAKEDARPLAVLGQLQLEQHEFLSASVSLKKAIELDPGYATPHYHLARLLKLAGKQAEAAKELELFKKYHDEENKKGIVGLVSDGRWDYAGFLPSIESRLYD